MFCQGSVVGCGYAGSCDWDRSADVKPPGVPGSRCRRLGPSREHIEHMAAQRFQSERRGPSAAVLHCVSSRCIPASLWGRRPARVSTLLTVSANSPFGLISWRNQHDPGAQRWPRPQQVPQPRLRPALGYHPHLSLLTLRWPGAPEDHRHAAFRSPRNSSRLFCGDGLSRCRPFRTLAYEPVCSGLSR